MTVGRELITATEVTQGLVTANLRSIQWYFLKHSTKWGLRC